MRIKVSLGENFKKNQLLWIKYAWSAWFWEKVNKTYHCLMYTNNHNPTANTRHIIYISLWHFSNWKVRLIESKNSVCWVLSAVWLWQLPNLYLRGLIPPTVLIQQYYRDLLILYQPCEDRLMYLLHEERERV